jgi:methylmalonyl-CoA/ethylmalonyl-CoA epimerase
VPEVNTDDFQLIPHHCGISVPDLDASIAWYRDMLDFTLEKRLSIDELAANIAFLRHGNFLIELFEIKDAEPLPEGRSYPNKDIQTHGTKHIAFSVDDVPEYISSLKKRGADIAMDVNMMEGKAMAFIRDNTGNLIEIVETGSP